MIECWPLLERCLKGKLEWYEKNLKNVYGKQHFPVTFRSSQIPRGFVWKRITSPSEVRSWWLTSCGIACNYLLSCLSLQYNSGLLWHIFMRLHHIHFPHSTCSLTKCTCMSLVRASIICSSPVSKNLVRAIKFREVTNSKFASLTSNEEFRDFCCSCRLVPGS